MTVYEPSAGKLPKPYDAPDTPWEEFLFFVPSLSDNETVHSTANDKKINCVVVEVEIFLFSFYFAENKTATTQLMTGAKLKSDGTRCNVLFIDVKFSRHADYFWSDLHILLQYGQHTDPAKVVRYRFRRCLPSQRNEV